MVQTGCIVAGEVTDSTLLRGARIESGATVKNCLIGEGAIIGKDAKLSGVVVGHRSVVPPGHIQSEGTF
jgi:glucose-1-phosphate adenylyltransferase